MVLHVLADTRQIVPYVDAERLQPMRAADTRPFEDKRRIDRSSPQQPLTIWALLITPAALAVAYCPRPSLLHDEPFHLGAGQDLEIAATARGLKVGLGSVEAQA